MSTSLNILLGTTKKKNIVNNVLNNQNNIATVLLTTINDKKKNPKCKHIKLLISNVCFLDSG